MADNDDRNGDAGKREDPVDEPRETTGQDQAPRHSAAKADGSVEESREAAEEAAGEAEPAARKLAEKARRIGDRTPEIASQVLEQTTKLTRDVFGRMQEGWSSAYEAGSRFMQDAYHSAGAYADRHKSTAVMKKLTAEREKLNQKLGSVIYTKYKDEGAAPADIFELQEVKEIMDQCENVDREVVRIGEQLDRSH